MARCTNPLRPMFFSNEDELAYICSFAAGDPTERVVDKALPALIDKESSPSAVGDFTTVCEVLGSLPKRSFEQRSWQLAERMRNARRQKKRTAIRKPTPADVAI